MCAVAATKVHLENIEFPKHNNTIQVILMLVTYGVGLLVVSLLAFSSIVYHYVYMKYIKPKEDENNEEELERKEKFKVYEMLDEFSLTTKIKDNPKNGNIFREVGRPKITLLEFSNEIARNNINLERFNADKFEPIDDGDGSDSARTVRKRNVHVKKLKEENSFSENPNEGFESTKTIPLIPLDQKVLTHMEDKSPISSHEKPSKLLTPEQEAIKQNALEVLEDENVYVNLRYSQCKIKEEFKDPLNKNNPSYYEAYDAIDSNIDE